MTDQQTPIRRLAEHLAEIANYCCHRHHDGWEEYLANKFEREIMELFTILPKDQE